MLFVSAVLTVVIILASIVGLPKAWADYVSTLLVAIFFAVMSVLMYIEVKKVEAQTKPRRMTDEMERRVNIILRFFTDCQKCRNPTKT